MSTIENVSRRGFLQGVLSTGAFVLSLKVLPQSAWAADCRLQRHLRRVQ